MLLKHVLSVTATTVLMSSAAFGQYYGSSGCSSCSGAPSIPSVSSYAPSYGGSCGPMMSAASFGPVSVGPASCAPMMSTAMTVGPATCTPLVAAAPIPVQTTHYQRVPVTTYTRERKTVKEPYYVTDYEDREVTVYEPVSQQRTVEVPTMNYQTVTENRVVQRDLGRWQTNYQPIKKCAPCQVDCRPGMIGWLNRTGYAFRSSMIPNYRTTRTYVPRPVACNVPVTRRVAVPGTRQVVVNETKMVARRKTERVEVRKLAYREREVTVMKPQVAYRTVPIGTTTAYGFGGSSFAYGGLGGSSVAYDPYGTGFGTAFIEDEDDSRLRRAEVDPRFDDRDRDRVSNRELDRTGRTFNSDEEESGYRRTERDSESIRKSSYPRTIEPREDELKAPQTFPPDFPGGASTRDPRSRLEMAAYRPPSKSRSRGWKAAKTSQVRTAAAERKKSETDSRVTMNDK